MHILSKGGLFQRLSLSDKRELNHSTFWIPWNHDISMPNYAYQDDNKIYVQSLPKSNLKLSQTNL